jgi:IS5 family transposase
LLARTIEVAVTLKLIAKTELSQIIVDSTVQEKAIAHPTDSQLLETARSKLVEVAKAEGIELKQTYAKEGQLLGYKAGRYAHARQFKRMRKVIKRQSTIVGRLHRDVSRKMTALSQAVQEALGHSVAKAARLIAQTRSHTNKVQAKDKQPKLYSWHAPEVECISKGKSRRPYEFGVKVGIATTLKGTLIVGARAFPGNPYDGHTLNEQVEQASILMQATGLKPETVYVDLGYRGVDKDNLGIDIKHRGKFKSMTDQEKKMLKRRQAIEPIIGHLKVDHRMNRCHLKGSLGDSLHAVLCAAGYNIRWLLRMIIKKGVGLFLRLLQAVGLTDLQRKLRQIFTVNPANSASINWVMG